MFYFRRLMHAHIARSANFKFSYAIQKELAPLEISGYTVLSMLKLDLHISATRISVAQRMVLTLNFVWKHFNPIAAHAA